MDVLEIVLIVCSVLLGLVVAILVTWFLIRRCNLSRTKAADEDLTTNAQDVESQRGAYDTSNFRPQGTPEYFVNDYNHRIIRNTGVINSSFGITRNTGVINSSSGITRNTGVINSSSGITRNTGVINSSSGITRNTGVINSSSGITRNTGVINSSSGITRNTGVINSSSGITRNTGVINSSSGITRNTGVINSSSGITRNTGVINSSSGLTRNTGVIDTFSGITGNYGVNNFVYKINRDFGVHNFGYDTTRDSSSSDSSETHTSNWVQPKFHYEEEFKPRHKPVQARRLDLHNFSLKDAMSEFKMFLNTSINAYRDNNQRRQYRFIEVITGRGKHSPGGIPIIKPAVENYLLKHDYKFSWTNPGMVRIDLLSAE